MRILGIESTAHTFGIGIAEDDTILTNVKDAYEPDEGGIHPGKAADHHYSTAETVLKRAIEDANIETNSIDGIAFSQGPGIPQCLQVGSVVARSLSQRLDIPLIGVNHPIAHIEIGRLTTNAQDPVTLYVSGGNSQVLAFAAGRYRVFGETLDIAIGNAIDKFARGLNIPHPGGPGIEKRAKKSENLIDLPYTVKGMDFSFSGLVTKTKGMIGDYPEKDLCYSFQEHAFAMLVEATERAMAHLDKDEVLVTGGVAANQRLQEMLQTMAEERNATSYRVSHEYCMDNGAMIAYAGLLKHQSGHETSLANSGIKSNWRTDEEQVTWRDG